MICHQVRHWYLILLSGLACNHGTISYRFQLCTSRKPSAKESQLLLDLMRRQQQSPGEVPPLTVVARVLLKLDETITNE